MKKLIAFICFILLSNSVHAESGTCVYLVGLSGAGKTTLSTSLKEHLLEIQEKPVLILDGDIIRKYLSNKLGFSREDRSINVRRIGYVASLIVEAGGICICANIAPYEEDRVANRELISKVGEYIEVFVDTPLSVCEERDVKGLYRAAREGKITNFTGISDPFERPMNSEVLIDSSKDVDQTVQELVSKLRELAPRIFN